MTSIKIDVNRGLVNVPRNHHLIGQTTTGKHTLQHLSIGGGENDDGMTVRANLRIKVGRNGENLDGSPLLHSLFAS